MVRATEITAARAERLKNAPERLHRYYKNAWNRKSRQQAIRVFCLECVCWVSPEVERCTAPACPLYEFRLDLTSNSPEPSLEQGSSDSQDVSDEDGIIQ